jgi:acyl-homoserine-lactone acylase
MKFFVITFLFSLSFTFTFGRQPTKELSAWQQQANRITIIRDKWGVPHIYGKTDADAAFGIMYTQCEDNYWQLEETYIHTLGRAGEIYGENALDNDAAVALYECVVKGKRMYAKAPAALKKLCDAAAAGINYFLEKNPNVEKRLLTRYEPWFFLVPSPHSPASHGVQRTEIRAAYEHSISGAQPEGLDASLMKMNSGSNTFALAPSKTKSGNSMLLINPHVGFFGEGQRYEAHLISEEGLNVSGFAILGTFYIWSGFNQHAGWAHTNTGSDYEDVYLENFNHPSDPSLYRYGNVYKKAVAWTDTILYKTEAGLKKKIFQFSKTHHGPIVAHRDSLRITMRHASDNIAEYIMQAWAMCKARNFKDFTAAMSKVQLSTNTMYADRSGNIAYWHGNAIPRRDTSFDWRFPVDGSNLNTEWKGMHRINEVVHVINPKTGWLQNCNSTPFLAAGVNTFTRSRFPPYMAYDEQTFRAEEALRLLQGSSKLSFDEFQQMVTSNHLPMMAAWLPDIIKAFDNKSMLYHRLIHVVDTLRRWDNRSSVNSKATTLGVFWYTSYVSWVRAHLRDNFNISNPRFSAYLDAGKLPISDSIAIMLLYRAVDTLERRYGTAFINWGDINRLQRVHTSGKVEKFDDTKPSLPIGAVSGQMGSLFSYNSRVEPGQKKMYGTGGNTYVAVIEFGKRLKAKSVVYFGQSSDPASPHYFDQAPLYAQGKFKDVYFYREDVDKHAKRTYHP